jgi:histidinol-phosphatase (PHP family)
MARSCLRGIFRLSPIAYFFPIAANLKMILVSDYHTHPQGHQIKPYSLALLQPWADRCRALGIRSLAFTDHDRYHTGVDFDVIDRLRERNADLQILAGIELDNDPETSAAGLRWVEQNWDRLDYVLGSVHYFRGETLMFDSADQSDQTRSRGANRAFAQYVEELQKLIQRGLIDCLAHLDLVKIHALYPEQYEPMKTFQPILELVQKAGLAIEASTAGWRKTVNAPYPHPAILRRAVDLGIPITAASDAHSYVQIAEDYDRLNPILEAAGVQSITLYQRHQPQAEETLR